MTVLCLIESDAGGAADASLRALGVSRELAASAGESVGAVWFGPALAVSAADLAAAGVSAAWAIESAKLSGYAPLAWATALAALSAGRAAPVSAVVAAATDHGNEVLAHLAAISDLPMAANCVSASLTGPGEFLLVRQRWA